MARTYATWNPDDKHANITLSNWNLTATLGDEEKSLRATIWVSSWKWYWEITWFAKNAFTGMATSSEALTWNIWNTSAWWSLHYSSLGTTHKHTNWDFPLYGSTFWTSDVIGVALDMDNGTITFYKNNSSFGQAFTWVSGTIYPAATPCKSSMTANFWASTMAYTAPSWYNQWIYVDAFTPQIIMM